MATPLEGLLVVAIEQAVAAPMCTSRLADAGARVIKIERREGETARHYDSSVGGSSAYFVWLNRGKESIVLDLKDADDLRFARRLIVEHADILVQNLAPGALARLGLGATELLEQNPRLICVDIVGYSSSTTYKSMRAYDMLVQAESGICAVTGTHDTPCKVGVSVADICTGMNAHAAILEALIERQRTGTGRTIEVSMFDSMADWMSVPVFLRQYGGTTVKRTGLSHASIYPYCAYSCLDGDIVIAVQNPAEWKRFCEGVLNDPGLVEDARFCDNPRRVEHRDQLDVIIQSRFGTLTCREAAGLLETNKLAYGSISSVDDLTAHPALRRVPVLLPDGTEVCAIAPAIHPQAKPARVPALGEHTDMIRREFRAHQASDAPYTKDR